MPVVCLRWTIAVCLALASVGCPAHNEVNKRPTAIPIEIDRNVTDDLKPPARHRYLVKVPDKSTVTLSVSWNNQDGIDRILFQKGTEAMETIDTRSRQKVTHTAEISPGFYYIEIIPGEVETTYNLLVRLSRP